MVGKREATGYGVWLTAAVVAAVPEIWAELDEDVPWPTISGTVGHLEYLWSGTAVIVVGAIVFSALQTLRYLLPDPTAPGGRTVCGRVSMQPETASEHQLSPWLYFPSAALAVGGGSLVASQLDDSKWHLAYVLYGLIALFWVVIPSAVAYFFARDVPFPTLFQTVVGLERRLPRVGLLVAAGLVVLLLHLAFYPWPDISHVLQQAPPTTNSP